jgi:hypothetical protein
MEHRQFTNDEIANALSVLRSNKGNAKKTAKHLGISRTTLRQWAGLSPVRGKQVSGELVQRKSLELADQLDSLALRLANKVADGLDMVPMETSGDARNLLIGLGITTEKASFARGGPTNRVESLKISLVVPGALRSTAGQVLDGSYTEVELHKELSSGE